MTYIGHMERTLPEVKPLGPFTDSAQEHVCGVLNGLRPGLYTTALLWPRYQAWCRWQKVKPMGRNGFGIAMEKFTGGHVGRRGNARVYRVTEEHLRIEGY